MIPEPVVFRREILEFRQALVDHGPLVTFKVVLAHLIQSRLKCVQEVFNPALQVPAVLFTLNQDAVSGPDIVEAGSRKDNVAKLFNRTELVEARLVRHLSQKQQLGTNEVVVTVPNIQAVLNAVVDVFRIAQLLFPNEVAARWPYQTSSSWDLVRRKSPRLDSPLHKVGNLESLLLVQVAVRKNFNLTLCKNLWEEILHVLGSYIVQLGQ